MYHKDNPEFDMAEMKAGTEPILEKMTMKKKRGLSFVLGDQIETRQGDALLV